MVSNLSKMTISFTEMINIRTSKIQQALKGHFIRNVMRTLTPANITMLQL